MTLDLSTFKSALGAFSITSIVYIDEEGSEIPIDSECEFQEALRLARLNKTSLKLIFYCEKPELNEIMNFDQYEFGSNPTGKFAGLVRKSRRCHGDIPPEWFTDYMKKFKKELLHEMKSYINETVHSAVTKEKRKSEKVTVGELFAFPDRKKKKASERDLTDLIDQRQMRLPKKSYASKNESFGCPGEILIDMLQDERRVPESKHHSKSKSDRICSLMCDRKNSSKKSASFDQSNVCLFLPLGSDFTKTVEVTNDGNVQWSVPYLECFEYEGLFLDKFRISLPKLFPSDSCLVSLRGKLSAKAGIHYLKCKVVDGLERIGPVFICWIRVSDPVSPVKSARKLSNVDDSDLRVGKLVDVEKDLIASSQKKIEENINEIQRRLRDIDLLQPSTCTEQKSENGADPYEKLLLMRSSCSTEWADPADCDTADEVSTSLLRKEDENKETKVDIADALSHSSSELSITLLSEEEDNFLVVPSEGLSSAESANEYNLLLVEHPYIRTTIPSQKSSTPIFEAPGNPGCKKFDESFSDKKSPIADLKENGGEFKEQPVKPEIQNESLQRQADRDEASASVEDLHPSQASPTRNRWSPFAEVFSKSKSSSTPILEAPGNPGYIKFDESVSDKKSLIAEPKENGAELNEQPVKPEIQNEFLQRQADIDEASASVEDLHPSQASPTRNRWSLFAEDFSKPKKMKSKSSEYRFKAPNLTQPTFRKLEGRPSRFMFTGEKEAKAKKSSKQSFKGTSPPFGQGPGFFDGKRSGVTAGETQKSNESGLVPKTDALGRVIYAVNSTGCCIPVERLPEYWERTKSPKNSGQRTQPRQTYPLNDSSNSSTFPVSLSNVVWSAFNTAKYVINNLQSALVTEGKTEMGKPAYEYSRKQSEYAYAMDRLCEMGYLNVELNGVLLLLNENDICKVVEALIKMQEKSP